MARRLGLERIIFIEPIAQHHPAPVARCIGRAEVRLKPEAQKEGNAQVKCCCDATHHAEQNKLPLCCGELF